MNLARMVELACIWEATVPKPGNVHPGASFNDMCYDDFVRSAKAIAPVLGEPEGKSVGQLVLESVQATQRAVGKNTNLGIILLLAPLVKVFSPRPFRPGAGPRDGLASISEVTTKSYTTEEPLSPPDPFPDGEREARYHILVEAKAWGSEVQHALEAVLDALTVDDTRLVYQAIRLTHPGGLGKVKKQDVSEEPTVTLRQAMKLASHRDHIACEYMTGYSTIFTLLLPALHLLPSTSYDAIARQIQWIFLFHLTFRGDTLIRRKEGPFVEHEMKQRAGQVLNAGWPEQEAGRQAYQEFDAWLRADGHRRNPGTTADLVCATLFLAFARGTLPTVYPLE